MRRIFASLMLVFSLLTLSACQLLPSSSGSGSGASAAPGSASATATGMDAPLLGQIPAIPAYSGSYYVTLNDNKPFFTQAELSQPYGTEMYGALDKLGRCTGTFAIVGQDTMPSETRGNIGSVKPTGWWHVEYSFVDGLSLYNRCHLIAWSLTNEEANDRNLVTGTRTMNTAQVPFEQNAMFYVRDTGGHVAYRSTPVFSGDNLVCDGILMEAYSLEDQGKSVQFCAFFYDIEPGVDINYATGESKLAEKGSITYDAKRQEGATVTQPEKTSSSYSGESFSEKPIFDQTVPLVYVDTPEQAVYVLNIKTMKFHDADCPNALAAAEKNRLYTTSDRDLVMAAGFEPSGCCNP